MLFFRAFLLGCAVGLSVADATFLCGGGPATPFTDCSLAFLGVLVTVLAEAATVVSENAAASTNIAMGFMAACLTLKTGYGRHWLQRFR